MEESEGQFRIIAVYNKSIGPQPGKSWRAAAYIHYLDDEHSVEVVAPDEWFATKDEAIANALEAGIQEAMQLNPANGQPHIAFGPRH